MPLLLDFHSELVSGSFPEVGVVNPGLSTASSAPSKYPHNFVLTKRWTGNACYIEFGANRLKLSVFGVFP